MISPLQVFQTREVYGSTYQVPAVDVLSDETGGVLLLVPNAPPIFHVALGYLEWGSTANADGYIVEYLSGTIWLQLQDVGDVLSLSDAAITAPGYYRVKAYNVAGKSLPSNVMFLEDDSSS